MPRRYTPERTSLALGLALIAAFVLHPRTNHSLLLWSRPDPLEGLRGTLTYAFSHMSWLHLGVNVLSIVLFGQFLGRHRSRLVLKSAAAGAIGGAIAFHIAVSLGRAGLALQGASSVALAIIACAAVELAGVRRVLALVPLALAAYPFSIGGTWFAHLGGCLAGIAIALEHRYSTSNLRAHKLAHPLALRKAKPQ